MRIFDGFKWLAKPLVATPPRLWGTIALAVSLVVLWIVLSSDLFQECVKSNYEGPPGQPFEKYISGHAWIWQFCFGTFLNQGGAAITALATIALTGSTIGLWISTRQSVRVAQHALQTTERAFVFLDGFDAEITTAAHSNSIVWDELPPQYQRYPDLFLTRFAVQPRWKNGGSTPTQNMTIRLNWRGPPDPMPPDYSYSGDPEPFFLAPQSVARTEIVEIPGAKNLIDWGLNPIGIEPLLLIWGRADYSDIFGTSHFVEWCCRVRFDRHDGRTLRVGFIPWGPYNRSD